MAPDLDSSYQIIDEGEQNEMPEQDSGSEADMADEPQEPQEPQQDDSEHCFTGHTGPVYAVAWNQGRQEQVASGSGDDVAYIWQTGGQDYDSLEGTTHELRGHTDTVACLAYNSDGQFLASGGLDGMVKIWSSQDGSLVQSLEGPVGGIEWLAWHPRGDIILAGTEDFTVWMWNARYGVSMQVLTGHSGPVTCGQFTPDGKSIVTGGGEGDESLRLWEPKTGVCTQSIQDPHNFHSAGITVLAVRQDSHAAVTGSEDFTARLVNLQTGKVFGVLAGHEDSIEAVAFIAQTSLVVTGSVDGTMRVWDSNTFTQRALCQHSEAVVRLLCQPGQPLVYTACLDGCLRCWDVRTGSLTRSWQGHTEGIQDIAISPDGSKILTGSDDCTARIFALHQ